MKGKERGRRGMWCERGKGVKEMKGKEGRNERKREGVGEKK